MNLVYGLALHEFSVAQVDRAPARCLEGHRLESWWDLRFFPCTPLVTCWLIYFHICFFELKNLPSFILSPHGTTSTLLILAVCRTRVKYEASIYIWRHSSWVLRSSSGQRAPARCLGGHRIESYRGPRFFLCPTLVTCRLIHFHKKKITLL